MRDLYAILEVERGAEAPAIKRAYRDLTRRFHPDLHRGQAWAAEHYRDIIDAYSILGDARTRALYDEFGELSLTRGFDVARARAGRASAPPRSGPWSPPRPSSRPASPGPSSPPPPSPTVDEEDDADADAPLDFDDLKHARRTLFDDILGRFWRGREVRLQDIDATGRDARAEVSVPLARAVVGCNVQVRVHDPAAATGARIVEVAIPAGVDDGAVLQLSGRGEGGSPPGDLHVVVHVLPDPTLTRDGLDLHLEVPVTLLELYRGGSIDVATPRGTVAVQLPAAYAPSRALRLRGRGIEGSGAVGDLFLKLRVELPPAGDAELLRALERLAAASQARPGSRSK